MFIPKDLWTLMPPEIPFQQYFLYFDFLEIRNLLLVIEWKKYFQGIRTVVIWL